MGNAVWVVRRMGRSLVGNVAMSNRVRRCFLVGNITGQRLERGNESGKSVQRRKRVSVFKRALRHPCALAHMAQGGRMHPASLSFSAHGSGGGATARPVLIKVSGVEAHFVFIVALSHG